MSLHIQAEHRAFDRWLRTGRRSLVRPIELKFNPYHDPRNGQFTFAPGGPRSVAGVIISERQPAARQTNARPSARGGIGGNGGPPLNDPMTLSRVFPGLGSATPSGRTAAERVFYMADGILGFTGQATAMTAELNARFTAKLLDDIKAIDPSYRFQSLGAPQSIEGQQNLIQSLRQDRAAAYYRAKGELRPLQVETLRALQERADSAYVEGVALFNAGRLKPRLSREEAIGNFVDRQTRAKLRSVFQTREIAETRSGPVRVIGREYESSGSDLAYRIPDARVGGILFDVTLSRKTISTAQIRGFLASDMQPTSVIIVRPSQLGPNHTYAIPATVKPR